MSQSNKSRIRFNTRNFVVGILMAFCSILSMAVSANKELPPQVSYDGMELIPHTKSSILYRKSGVDFKRYDKLILLPCQVAFKKNWKRDYNRDHRSTRVSDKDMERIKRELADLFNEIFSEELKSVKNFSVVSEPGETVVLMRPAIINLDAYAPDVKTTSRRRTYVDHAGEGTLYLEVYDSVSGEILGRVIDRRETRDAGFYRWANRASNLADVKALLRQWAKKLHKKLEEVHASSNV